MSEQNNKIELSGPKKSHFFRNFVVCVISVIVFIVLVITGATLWLTPQNLTNIINKEANEYLNAEVTVSDAKFTFWSSFPHLNLSIDSIQVISKSLDGIGENYKGQLPAYSDTLFTSGRLSGGINIYSLLLGKIELKNIEVEHPGLNLVAINDSLNNYNIIPSSSKKSHIPELEFNVIEAKNPKPIRYFSVASASDISAQIDSFAINQVAGKRNDYQLLLKGDMSALVTNIQLLRNFPFDIEGNIKLNFYPLKIALQNMAIGLGNTSGYLDLDMNLEDKAKINNLSYDIGTFSVLNLLDYFPEKYLKWRDKIDLDLKLKISTRLTKPYTFTSEKLPSFEFNFEAPRGEIAMNDIAHHPLKIDYYGIKGKLMFDGDHVQDSYLQLSDINVSSQGMKCLGNVRVDRVLSSPDMYADVSYNIDFDKTKTWLEMLNIGLSGSASGELRSHVKISSIENIELREGTLEGNMKMNSYALNMPQYNFVSKGNNLATDFSMEVPDFNNLLSSTKGQLNISSKNNTITYQGKEKIGYSNLSLQVVKYPAIKNTQQISVDLKADKVTYDSPTDSLHLELGNNHLVAEINDLGNFDVGSNVKIADTYSAIKANFGKNSFNSLPGQINFTATKTNLKGKYPGGDFKENFVDEEYLNSQSHTPEYLAFNASGRIKEFFNSWKMSLAFANSGSDMYLNGFPSTIYLGPTQLDCNLDSVNLNQFSARIDKSYFKVNGTFSNLRNILASNKPSKIPVNLNVKIDTLNINKLAKVYELGVIALKGEDAVVPVRQAAISSSDTITLLIPRNIDARIHASADEAIYTNLKFYNIGADIKVKGGNADINNVSLASDFGDAALKIKYNSDDIENMGMSLDANIRDINLTHIYSNFPALPKMMPQVKNLTGVFTARCSGSLLLYPNMYINIPSLSADLDVEGEHLNLHQTHFIRKVTKMMFIPNSDDIHIRNINIKASVHDNLLEVMPFHLSFANYDLVMGGVNNFNGDLDYHLGIKKDPFHLPFGINIQGKFHDPKLRFGGSSFKTKNAMKVTSVIENDDKVNLTKELKYYLKVFVHKAATSDS